MSQLTPDEELRAHLNDCGHHDHGACGCGAHALNCTLAESPHLAGDFAHGEVVLGQETESGIEFTIRFPKKPRFPLQQMLDLPQYEKHLTMRECARHPPKVGEAYMGVNGITYLLESMTFRPNDGPPNRILVLRENVGVTWEFAQDCFWFYFAEVHLAQRMALYRHLGLLVTVEGA